MKPLAQNSMIQNRYLVVQMIGKGGMGEVYLAVDQRLGSAVALKRTFFKENAGLASAFEREARILGRLRHPVLPKVIDHFADGPDQYLVMEHISGEDLGKRLEAAGKPFPISWVMFWADQLLDALNYLHSHEPPIIHRDIKPENLKLTDDNHIVLLDFGLSKDFDSKADTASLGSGSIVGYSPYFASMEQVRGTGTDARSDLYSFSATIYQLLTNVMPADALTRADAMLGGVPDPIEPITSLNTEVSPAISDVILRGLSVRQDERYASAAVMQKELRRAYNSAAAVKPEEAPAGADTLVMGIPTASDGNSAITLPRPPKSDAAQADIKTQVMSTPTASDAPPDEVEAVAEAEAVEAADNSAAASPELAAAPIPESDGAETVDAAAVTNTDTVGAPIPPVPQSIPAATAKKKSRAGLVFAGLIGLLLLAGIAAAGGWFAYTRYYLPSQVTASPTPAAELPTPTPAAEPTATPLQAETNTATPSESEVAGGEANTNSAAAPPLPTRGVTTAPVDGKPPTPGPVARATPKPAQTAAPKATPAKAPGDRTVILQ